MSFACGSLDHHYFGFDQCLYYTKKTSLRLLIINLIINLIVIFNFNI